MTEPTLPLAPDGANRWKTRADARYWNAFGPWGGWTAGALLKAVQAEPAHRGSPVALTINLMSGFEQEEVLLTTRLMRATRSMEFWSVELSQAGEENVCAQAMVTLAQRRDTEHFLEIPMPDAPSPETIPPPPHGAMTLAFGQMFETRGVKGYPMFPARDDTQSISWVRNRIDAPLDHVMLAMYADIFAPRIFYKTGRPGPVSTISMNVYFHATEPEIAAVGHDFVLTEAAARRGGGGFFDHQAALWRRDGVLLATTEQLSWFK